jgi:hypothetical protein
MFRTKVTFAENQTPEQRKAHAESWRREDARRRIINNAFGFWRICSKPLCRRNRTCSQDMHACFERHWRPIPEDQKEWIRGAIVAKHEGASGDAVLRAADARRVEYLELQERMNAGATPTAPLQGADDGKAAPPAQARIWQL